MGLSKILSSMVPTKLHHETVNLLDKANNLQNPAVTRKASKITVNIFAAVTGTAATIQEAISTAVKIPAVMLAGSALTAARLFKRDFMSSADNYVPTISSTWGTAKRTAGQALGVISSVGAIVGEVFFIGSATPWNLKAQQHLGNATIDKPVTREWIENKYEEGEQNRVRLGEVDPYQGYDSFGYSKLMNFEEAIKQNQEAEKPKTSIYGTVEFYDSLDDGTPLCRYAYGRMEYQTEFKNEKSPVVANDDGAEGFDEVNDNPVILNDGKVIETPTKKEDRLQIFLDRRQQDEAARREREARNAMNNNF
jgi:hypothetical protein